MTTNFKAIFRKDAPELSEDDFEPLANQVADRMNGDDYDQNKRGLNKHEIDQLADLVVESTGGQWDRPRALHFMMHSKTGAAMVHRLRKAVGKVLTNKRKEQKVEYKVTDVAKVCKGIVDQGSTTLSEKDLTDAITLYGKHLHPGMKSDAAAFSRVYTAQDEIGLAFRKAVQIAKGLAIILPVYSSVGGTPDDDQTVDDPTDALAQLDALAAEQHARQPEMSLDKCFSAIYQDPANVRLAQAERRQARARLG